MSNNSKIDRISICHKDNCIHADGENAEVITFGLFLMFVCIGLAALTKAN